MEIRVSIYRGGEAAAELMGVKGEGLEEKPRPVPPSPLGAAQPAPHRRRCPRATTTYHPRPFGGKLGHHIFAEGGLATVVFDPEPGARVCAAQQLSRVNCHLV